MFNLKRNQQGLAVVEMTLVLPVLLLLIFATAEFSRMLYQYNTLTKVTRDASRFLASDPDLSENDVRSILMNNSTSEILPGLAVDDTADSTDIDIDVNGEFITVTVSYDWEPIFADILTSFVSDTSFDLSFDLVSTYTVRAL